MFLFKLLVCAIAPVAAQLGNNACKHIQDYPSRDSNPSCYYNPDVDASTPVIIRNHGLPVESHHLTTPDGYILQLFRIPPKQADNRKHKQPIFFNHGLLADSSAFAFAGERSLALSLARAGYDIWLYNHRGTKYSSGHVSLDHSRREYWNWTVDTVAANDIPATLELIARVTGQGGSIIYMGHSRATMLAFMYVLDNPGSALLRGIVALAPVAYHDAKPYVKAAFRMQTMLSRFGMWALFQNPVISMNIARILCPHFPAICEFIASLFSGPSDQFLPDDLLNFFKHFPSEYSLKECLHQRQLIETGRLQKFDYGKYGNLEAYGQEEPPVYDLRRITIPVFLFYARNDIFVTETNVLKQFRDLGSQEKEVFKIPTGIEDEGLQWAHNDFLYGKDIQKFLYPPLIKVLEKALTPENYSSYSDLEANHVNLDIVTVSRKI